MLQPLARRVIEEQNQYWTHPYSDRACTVVSRQFREGFLYAELYDL